MGLKAFFQKWSFNFNWRYAIGEFLIVVLGILAAFQLDSWKEERDDQRLLVEYLTDLEVGLKSDSLFFGSALAYFGYIESDIDSTVQLLRSEAFLLPGHAQKSIRRFADWYRIYISNAAFSELNNSGRLNLIEDKRLRYDLIAYYQYIDFIKILDKEYTQSINRMQENLLTRLDFQDPDILTISAEDAPLVLNYLQQKQTYMDTYLSHRTTCQEINDTIRRQIAGIMKEVG